MPALSPSGPEALVEDAHTRMCPWASLAGGYGRGRRLRRYSVESKDPGMSNNENLKL